MAVPDREGRSTPPPIPSESVATGSPPLGSEGKQGGRNPRSLIAGIVLAIAAVALGVYSIGLMGDGETSTTDTGGTGGTNPPTNPQEESENGNTLEIEYESTSLHRAAKDGDLTLVKKLLGSGLLGSRGDADVRDELGMTPLHYAADEGHKEIVELLIARGADVNANAGAITSATALHGAAGGHVEIAKLLIDHGADVNARAKNRATPLHFAADYVQTEVAELLVSEGADIDAKDENGNTPLHKAFAILQYPSAKKKAAVKKLVAYLLSKGADIYATNDITKTPRGMAPLFLDDDLEEIIRPYVEEGRDAFLTKRRNRETLLQLAFRDRAEWAQKKPLEQHETFWKDSFLIISPADDARYAQVIPWQDAADAIRATMESSDQTIASGDRYCEAAGPIGLIRWDGFVRFQRNGEWIPEPSRLVIAVRRDEQWKKMVRIDGDWCLTPSDRYDPSDEAHREIKKFFDQVNRAHVEENIGLVRRTHHPSYRAVVPDPADPVNVSIIDHEALLRQLETYWRDTNAQGHQQRILQIKRVGPLALALTSKPGEQRGSEALHVFCLTPNGWVCGLVVAGDWSNVLTAQ